MRDKGIALLSPVWKTGVLAIELIPRKTVPGVGPESEVYKTPILPLNYTVISIFPVLPRVPIFTRDVCYC